MNLKSILLAFIATAIMPMALFSGCNQPASDGLPKVMKIGRTTCVPCVKMSKLLNDLKPKLEGQASVEIIDIDEDYDAVKKYNVTGIPVTIFFDGQGKEIYRQIGLLEEKEIYDWLEKAGMKK